MGKEWGLEYIPAWSILEQIPMLDSTERLEPCFIKLLLSSVQLLCHVQLFLTPWTAAC